MGEMDLLRLIHLVQSGRVGFGSWLCENAKTLERDRTSCSSRVDPALMLASDFNLDGELENVILAVVWLLAFLHSQAQKGTSRRLILNVGYRSETTFQVSTQQGYAIFAQRWATSDQSHDQQPKRFQ
jgi:hypothetical protein